MARKILTDKEKKRRRKKRLIVFLVILIILGALGYFGYRYIDKKLHPTAVEVKELDKVETKDYDYGYRLTDLDSKYYQDEFKKLKDILTQDEVNFDDYATQLAKCFAIDLYTMSTKLNKYDVGGLEFMYSEDQDNFEKYIINNTYDNLADNTFGDRKQDLPEVTNVNVVSTDNITYTLDDKKTDAYLVKMEISYKGTKAKPELSVVIVKESDGKKLAIVDVQDTLKAKYE
mgnify:CR=1 FL=1